MNKENCEVINDLLPLYIDDICSEESKKIVELHLKECDNCNNLYQMMKTDIKLTKDTDDRVIKKIKKKILIEKIVTAVLAVVLTIAIIISCVFPLFIEKVNMNQVISIEQVSVEEDENGDLWLVRSGNAAASSTILTEIYQTDGKRVFLEENYAKNNEETPLMIKVVFYENRMDKWMQQIMDVDSCTIKEEKSILCSKENKVKYDKIVFEQEKGKEKVLWERK